MNVLLDTNILGRMVEVGHPQHRPAADAVAALTARGDSPHLVPQVLYGFWVVATRPTTVNGLGLLPSQAAAEVAPLKALFPLLPDSPAVYPEWERLVRTYQVAGRSAHDTRLVAAMAVHGLTHVLSFNTADFARYAGITALDPAVVATPPIP